MFGELSDGDDVGLTGEESACRSVRSHGLVAMNIINTSPLRLRRMIVKEREKPSNAIGSSLAADGRTRGASRDSQKSVRFLRLVTANG